MMLVIIFEQIFLLYFDAGGRSLLIGDHLENCWLATSNSCIIHHNCYLFDVDVVKMILNELNAGCEIRLVEFVRNIPSERTKFPPLLNGGVKKRDPIQDRLPLRHV